MLKHIRAAKRLLADNGFTLVECTAGRAKHFKLRVRTSDGREFTMPAAISPRSDNLPQWILQQARRMSK